MSGIKIKLVEIDGEKCVPEECMRILMEFAAHRDLCEQCGAAFTRQAPFDDFCATGQALIRELHEQPEVSVVE